MERALFAYERLMLAGGRPYTVMIAARLSDAIEPERLRQALAWLQARHPALRSAIVERNGREHFVATSPRSPIPVRVVARATNVDWFAELCRELDQPLARVHGPLARLVWLRSEGVSEFILVADHVICDGRSVLILLGDLIDRLRHPDAERAAPPAFASIEELFGRLDRRAALATRVGAVFGGAFLYASAMRTRRPGPAPAPSYVLHWEIDEAVTASLAAAVRRERTTTYAALATAFLRAFLAVRGAGSLNRLVSPVDPRPFFAVKGSSLLFPIPSQVSLSLDRALDSQFWEQARRLGSDLLAGYLRLRPHRMAQIAERLHPLVNRVTRRALHGPGTNDLAFSHLGSVELASAPDQPIEALASLASLPWSEATAIMSLASSGRLRFCLISRETVLARAEAEQLRDHAMALIGSLERSSLELQR